jgi:hypothetical protein
MVTVITFLLIVDISLGVCALMVLRLLFYVKRTPPLPPGPKRYPLIGNVLDMPTEQEWLTFAKWGDIWGMLSFFLSRPNLDSAGPNYQGTYAL